MSNPEDIITQVRAWISQEPEFMYRERLGTLLEGLISGHPDAISEAEELFGSRLAFGTAGIRGPMKAGPGGMNRIVVSQTTAGLMGYLLGQKKLVNPADLLVVIGFDGRHDSETFAKDTAEVVSGYGIRALVLPQLLPTPVLAFCRSSTRSRYRCDANREPQSAGR